MQMWRSETVDNPKRGRLWIQILQQTSCLIIFTYFRGYRLSKIFENKTLKNEKFSKFIIEVMLRKSLVVKNNKTQTNKTFIP